MLQLLITLLSTICSSGMKIVIICILVIQIQVTSSDEDRCLMSAECNLAGLYPAPVNASIPLVPVPIHTKPKVEDNVGIKFVALYYLC